MLGAILGDMVGAPYEFDRGNKSKDFEFWNDGCGFTDDSVMTIAVAEALLTVGPDASEEELKTQVIRSMQDWGHRYPNAGYGGRFYGWLHSENPKPYKSWGNGSAMRVSAVGWLYDSLERTREVSRWTAEVTHNHPEGIKGAEATASAIYMARNDATKNEIKQYIIDEFGYDLSRTCDEIRPNYHHVESCQETVPEAITAFLEGENFEDVIRTAVSLGGDCDTLTCIAGSIAEAFYGMPAMMEAEVERRLSDDMISVLEVFNRARGREIKDETAFDGNVIISDAIADFHKETTNENFGRVLNSIYIRMQQEGRFLIPVILPQVMFEAFDPETVRVGDTVTVEEETRVKLQHISTDDGKMWLVAFTSNDEFRKGESSDTFTMTIEDVILGFVDSDGLEEGIIINPWGNRLFLTREFIGKLAKVRNEEKLAEEEQ